MLLGRMWKWKVNSTKLCHYMQLENILNTYTAKQNNILNVKFVNRWI